MKEKGKKMKEKKFLKKNCKKMEEDPFPIFHDQSAANQQQQAAFMSEQLAAQKKGQIQPNSFHFWPNQGQFPQQAQLMQMQQLKMSQQMPVPKNQPKKKTRKNAKNPTVVTQSAFNAQAQPQSIQTPIVQPPVQIQPQINQMNQMQIQQQAMYNQQIQMQQMPGMTQMGQVQQMPQIQTPQKMMVPQDPMFNIIISNLRENPGLKNYTQQELAAFATQYLMNTKRMQSQQQAFTSNANAAQMNLMQQQQQQIISQPPPPPPQQMQPVPHISQVQQVQQIPQVPQQQPQQQAQQPVPKPIPQVVTRVKQQRAPRVKKVPVAETVPPKVITEEDINKEGWAAERVWDNQPNAPQKGVKKRTPKVQPQPLTLAQKIKKSKIHPISIYLAGYLTDDSSDETEIEGLLY